MTRPARPRLRVALLPAAVAALALSAACRPAPAPEATRAPPGGGEPAPEAPAGPRESDPAEAAALRALTRDVTLTPEDVACESQAQHLTLEVKGAAAPDLLALFREMTGLTFRSEVDLSGVLVTSRLEDVPWDCVLQALAAKLDLRVDPEPEEIVLRPKG